MTYQADVKRVAQANIEELRGDLDRALHGLKRAEGDVAEFERQVTVLRALITLAEEDAADGIPPAMTLHEAMMAVLEDAPGRMRRAADLASEVNRRRLYQMRDGRPVEAQQIHARVGHYPHLFVKEGTFVKLVD